MESHLNNLKLNKVNNIMLDFSKKLQKIGQVS